MHNCRFALICKIAPSPRRLTISLTTGFGVEHGILHATCLTSHLCIECRVSSSQTLLPLTTFLSFEGPQLPIDEKQVWFFRWWHGTQPRSPAPPHCCLPALLPRCGAAVWAPTACPCPTLTPKALLCPQCQSAMAATALRLLSQAG